MFDVVELVFRGGEGAVVVDWKVTVEFGVWLPGNGKGI